jgi:NhaA family Na+:H+ antiporter
MADRPHPLARFLALESAGSVVLLAATVAALAWANAGHAGQNYDAFWRAHRHVVNDGLMTVFFLVVGLEMRRELTEGRLNHWRRAMAPAIAAVTGMAVPALIYAAITHAHPGGRGWGVPMATDIAFAVGALGVLGGRVPGGVRAFLLALAVADDVLTVAVLAVFYSHDVKIAALAVAAVTVTVLAASRRADLTAAPVCLAGGVVLWLALNAAGVEPALAGVAVGLLMPGPAAERLEDGLHPWATFAVLPAFVLANAGVHVTSALLAPPGAARIAAAVVASRVLGKLIGITAGAAVAVKLRLGDLPDGTRWGHIAGAGAMGSVGFTVPLLFADAALTGPLKAAATAALLAASVIGLGVGAAWFTTP